MKLEDQVVSLDLAKRLKELGVKQESLWWWHDYGKLEKPINDKNFLGKYNGWYSTNKRENDRINTYKYSAFTVAELGEMLPPSIECKSDRGFKYFIYLEMDKHIDQRPRGFRFRLRYRPIYNEKMMSYHNDEYRADTEANARAKTVIYLKEPHAKT